jgi:dihydrofolate synthase / folylpolyglutamate synthase
MFNQWLGQLSQSHVDLGLTRIKTVLQALNNPQDTIPTIHIAGTNGKGSTICMLGGILQAAGYTVGATISPHLIHPAERVQINNQSVSLTVLDALSITLDHTCRHLGITLTYFEAMIALAFLAFAQHPVDIALIEVGLGGRLDATNVLAKPLVTVLTGVDYDHTEWLGDTLALIATEKVGIFKPSVPVVLGPVLAPDVMMVALNMAKTLNCPVSTTDRKPLPFVDRVDLTTGLQWLHNPQTGQSLPMRLLGPYQVHNVVTVLGVIDQLIQQGWIIPQRAILQGLATAQWPGRLQWLSQHRLLVDGSHNPQGFRALSQALPILFTSSGAKNAPSIHWMLSLRANRNPAELMDVVRSWPYTASISFTTAGPHHAPDVFHSPEVLADCWLATCVNKEPEETIALTAETCPIKTLAHVQALLAKAGQKTSADSVGVVTGSLYTAGSVLQALL